MSGINGSMLSLLDDRHATACDGQEYSAMRPAPWGDGYAVLLFVWCGECGAADYELVDTHRPEGPA